MKAILATCILAVLNCLIAKSANPTFATDIAKIIYTNCSSCHRQGNIAPFALTNFDEVYQNRYGIQNSVQHGSMPPWPPATSYSNFAHERVLTNDEKNKIIDWVNAGAPRGEIAQEPPPPVFNSNFNLTDPTNIYRIPNYTLTQNNNEYRAFVIPSGNLTDKYLKSIEFVPGNKKVVHHILLFYDTTGVCKQKDDNDPLPGYTSFGGVGTNSAVLVQLWVPGQQVFNFPDGLGNRISKNADFVIQIHYAPGFVGQSDSTSFRIKFYPNTQQRNVNVAPVLNHNTTLLNGPLFIPKDSVKTFYSSYTIPINVSILGIGPHMHLIGESIKSFAVLPNNDTVKLIDIPHWDFHWQGGYTFKKVIKLPAGTKLYGEATYNNTVNNPHNPNNPPKHVYLGEGTEDEMMLIYFNWMLYQNGDEHIVLEDTSKVVLSLAEPSKTNNIIYPNPVKNTLQIKSENVLLGSTYQIINSNGKVVSKLFLLEPKIDVTELPSGMYFLILENQNKQVHTKFLKE